MTAEVSSDFWDSSEVSFDQPALTGDLDHLDRRWVWTTAAPGHLEEPTRGPDRSGRRTSLTLRATGRRLQRLQRPCDHGFPNRNQTSKGRCRLFGHAPTQAYHEDM